MSTTSRRNVRQRDAQAVRADAEQPAPAQPPADAVETKAGAEHQAPGNDSATPPPADDSNDAPATETPAAEQPPADAPQAAEPRPRRTADGRPLCRVGHDVAPELPACDKPEVIDRFGICGGHYAIRPDLRKEAYRG